MNFKRILSLLLSISLCVGCLTGLTLTVSAADGENVALGKPCRASSQWDEAGVPERVVNGVKNDYWARGQIMLEGTAATGGLNWIMIDLEQAYKIDSVSLYLRTMDDGSNKNVRLDFSNDPNFKTFESMIAFDDQGTGVKLGEENNYKVKFKTPYRYVRAVNTTSMFFILSEIEVYGELSTGAVILEPYTDVKGTEYEGAVNLIQSLDLMDPEEEKVFGTYHFITRAQAVDTIVKAFSDIRKPTYGEGVPFDDVDENHPLYDSIFTAYASGYIRGNGDGTFDPEGYVSGNELCTILLRAMGYTPRLEVDKAPSVAAQRLARSLGFYIESSDDEGRITRGDFAQTLYKAMLAPLYTVTSVDEDGVKYVDGDNVLTQKYGLTLYTEVVYENRITTLLDESKERDNVAVVGDKSFSDPNGVLDSFIGRSVIVGVYDNKPTELAFAWPSDDNNEVTVKAEDLQTSLSDVQSNKIIESVGDKKKRTYNLSPSAKYIYNGVAYPDAVADDVLIENGYITLVDNDDDEVYDIVDINSYVMYFVEGFTFSQNTVYIKGTTTKLNAETGLMEKVSDDFTVNGDNVVYYNSDGEKKSVSTMKKGSVVAVYASPYDNNYTIKAFEKSVTGVMTGRDGDFVYIDGEALELGPGFTVPTELGLGVIVDVYTDSENRVIYMDKTNDAEIRPWTMAFCVNWTNGGGFSDEQKFKVYTEDGEFLYLEPADNIVIDGVRMGIDSLNAMMSKGTDVHPTTGERYMMQNFWRYKLNSEGKIVRIDTTNYVAASENTDTLQAAQKVATDARYSSASNAFYYQNQFLFPVRSSAVAFTIPTVGGKYTTSDKYDKYYSVGGLTSIVSDKESAIDFEVDYYMVDDYGFPSYFAKMQDFPEGEMAVCSNDGAGYMLVTSLGTGLDAEGFECVNITGISFASGKEITISMDRSAEFVELGMAYQDGKSWFGYGNKLTLSSIMSAEGYRSYISSVTSINKGDVLRYEAIDSTTYAIERAFKYTKNALPTMNKTSWFDSTGGYTGFQFCTNRFQFGKVYDYNHVILDMEVNYSGDEGASVTNHEKYVADDVKGIAVYVIHDRGVDKETGDKLFSFKGGNYRVLFYTTKGAPSKAIVYPYDI